MTIDNSEVIVVKQIMISIDLMMLMLIITTIAAIIK